MTLVLSTSANPLNPVVRRRHYQQHRLWDFKDGPHEGSYPLDTPRAFRTVRREIIEKCAPRLTDQQMDELTEATRGLRKEDIERAVKAFHATGRISVHPEHPTNTCDPLTGSWQERLLNIPAVTRTLNDCGFSVKVLGGYYSGTAGNALVGKAKRAAAYVLNQGISWLGTNGTRLAPCFMFQAVRKG